MGKGPYGYVLVLKCNHHNLAVCMCVSNIGHSVLSNIKYIKSLGDDFTPRIIILSLFYILMCCIFISAVHNKCELRCLSILIELNLLLSQEWGDIDSLIIFIHYHIIEMFILYSCYMYVYNFCTPTEFYLHTQIFIVH